MALDQIIEFKNDKQIPIKVIFIGLNLDKNIYLLQMIEEQSNLKKKYIRNQCILVEDIILTSTFSDTVHFMEELKLFDGGNDQNKYLTLSTHQSTKNLKLKRLGVKNVFISKSEASTMVKIFNLSFKGYSVITLLENEFKLTPQVASIIIHKNNLLERQND